MPTILNFYGTVPYYGVPAQQSAATLTSDASLNGSSSKVETQNQIGAKCGALYYDAEASFSLTATPIYTPPEEGVSNPNSLIAANPFGGADVKQGCLSGQLVLAVLPNWLLAVNGSAPEATTAAIDSNGLTYSNTAAASVTLSGTVYRF